MWSPNHFGSPSTPKPLPRNRKGFASPLYRTTHRTVAILLGLVLFVPPLSLPELVQLVRLLELKDVSGGFSSICLKRPASLPSPGPQPQLISTLCGRQSRFPPFVVLGSQNGTHCCEPRVSGESGLPSDLITDSPMSIETRQSLMRDNPVWTLARWRVPSWEGETCVRVVEYDHCRAQRNSLRKPGGRFRTWVVMRYGNRLRLSPSLPLDVASCESAPASL